MPTPQKSAETVLVSSSFVPLRYAKRSNVYRVRATYRPRRVPDAIRDGLAGFADAARLSDDQVRKAVGTDAHVRGAGSSSDESRRRRGRDVDIPWRRGGRDADVP